MPDLPDWWQGFFLVGSDITINVTIEASDVTLPISIDAATVDVDVNLTGQDVTIDFNFADQAVAVFDAAKWFAHNAAQWTVQGYGTVDSGSSVVLSRVVPAGKVAFVCGLGVGYEEHSIIANILWRLIIEAAIVSRAGYNTGGGLIFDVPFRATAGETIQIAIFNYHSASTSPAGSFWGYDEDV